MLLLPHPDDGLSMASTQGYLAYKSYDVFDVQAPVATRGLRVNSRVVLGSASDIRLSEETLREVRR